VDLKYFFNNFILVILMVDTVVGVVDSKIAFNDWLKVELRVGLIELVEDIVGKDKLYKLLVDFSTVKRTIVAGLKPYYSKEELQGKKSVFVFNLAPARLVGIESNGMILAARNNENKYKVLLVDDSVPQGTKFE
jgi:methionyl-tRNA synthetase